MRKQPKRDATYLKQAEARLAVYPGGVEGFVADYLQEKASIADVSRLTGVAYRAMKRILLNRGIALRGTAAANTIHHRLHPERAQKVGDQNRTIRAACRPEVRAKMVATRRESVRRDPTMHINGVVGMGAHEKVFAAALSERGVEFVFNKQAFPYWLDFFFPALLVGVEIQADSPWPNRDRDATIREVLGLKTIIYFQYYQMRQKRVGDLVDLIVDIQEGRFDPSALGEETMLTRRPGKGAGLELNGYKFRRPFVRIRSLHPPESPQMGQNHVPDDDALDGKQSPLG